MKKLHIVTIGNALIWGAAILGAAVLLRGTEHAGMMVVILGGAAGASIITVGNALRQR